MTTEPNGERSLIIRDLAESVVAVAAKLKASLNDIEDVVPCYDTVGLYFKQKVPSHDEVVKALEGPVPHLTSCHHTIPVCYQMGDDFQAAAEALSVSTQQIIDFHSSQQYRCSGVGFVPGFAYLGELKKEISFLPRLATPRVRIEPGSVAITGTQTAVYPLPSPGGWWIIGKTPLLIVDEASDYFPISAGDFVRFQSIDEVEYELLRGQRL